MNSKTFEKNISMHQFILCSLMSLAWPIIYPNDIDFTLKKPKFYLPFITLLIVFLHIWKKKERKKHIISQMQRWSQGKVDHFRNLHRSIILLEEQDDDRQMTNTKVNDRTRTTVPVPYIGMQPDLYQRVKRINIINPPIKVCAPNKSLVDSLF